MLPSLLSSCAWLARASLSRLTAVLLLVLLALACERLPFPDAAQARARGADAAVATQGGEAPHYPESRDLRAEDAEETEGNDEPSDDELGAPIANDGKGSAEPHTTARHGGGPACAALGKRLAPELERPPRRSR